MANIKYIRVSTIEQNTARQETDTAKYEKVFIDKASGKNTDRPELKKMLDYVREGDIVTVESYDRFARSTIDLLTMVQELDQKGVKFRSLHENIDTTTPQGELMMIIFAGLAQFERALMLQRQKEGIAIAKAEGKYKGRQPIRVDTARFEKEYKQWKSGKQTATAAMKALNMKPNTFYRRVKEYEQQQQSA